MMGKTHIAVGVAAALLVAQPVGLGSSLVAVIGGSTGGVLCDIEVHSNRKCRDAFYARLLVLAIVLGAVLVDVLVAGPLTTHIRHADSAVLGFGTAVVLGTATYARVASNHRGFSHSLLALLLYSGGIAIIYAPLVPVFALGFVSHIALDILNKKPVQLFFPLRRGNVCLGLCYASGATNSAFLALGTLASLAGLGLAIARAT